MRRADRLFQLVQLLRSRRVCTGAWLAGELGVSVRTLYRYIADLQDAGVPVVGEAGVGYALQRGYELPPLTFTHEELEALVLGARLVQAWADPELAEAARAALRKVDAVLPPLLKQPEQRSAMFAMQFRTTPPAALGPLRRAIGDRRRVQVSYADAEGRRTERVVRPLGLYFWGRTWTLAAWCDLRDGYRNFRADRLEVLAVLDTTWPPDGDVSLDGFIEAMQAREH